MLRRILNILMITIITVMTVVAGRSAMAADSVSETYLGGGSCGATIPFLFTYNFAQDTVINDAVTVNGVTTSGSATQVAGHYTFVVDFGIIMPPPPATIVLVENFQSNPPIKATISISCAAAGATPIVSSSVVNPGVFFNPGDNRVDPKPGDLLAVWCNQPDTIVVYGINVTNSGGFWLASFSNKAVLKAGKQGIYETVLHNGQVSLSTDASGNYWLAWNGGEHHADGQPNHGYAKGFSCQFPS